MNKTLVIRFSSFGDIVQCMSVVNKLKNETSDEVHWVTRSDMGALLELNPNVNKVWCLDKNKGLIALFKLSLMLRKEKYTHVYDAHSNLRSYIISLFLNPPHFLRRSKERFKRILLFRFRKNLFDNPYKGIISYLKPLEAWNISDAKKFRPNNWDFSKVELTKEFDKESIVIAPSAAWVMKRWPISHWKTLIEICPDYKFTILGGPNDFFCEEIRNVAPARVVNLAGKLSLIESCKVVNESRLIISADTGLIHVADLLGKKGISLIGPTAFGFATGSHIKTLEVSLDCRPCSKDGRGSCSQDVWQKCMVEISPDSVVKEISNQLSYQPSPF